MTDEHDVNIAERLTRVEECVKSLSDKVGGLTIMLNPKTEEWNKASNDVAWLNKFFWVIFIAVCGVIVKMVLVG